MRQSQRSCRAAQDERVGAGVGRHVERVDQGLARLRLPARRCRPAGWPAAGPAVKMVVRVCDTVAASAYSSWTSLTSTPSRTGTVSIISTTAARALRLSAVEVRIRRLPPPCAAGERIGHDLDGFGEIEDDGLALRRSGS